MTVADALRMGNVVLALVLVLLVGAAVVYASQGWDQRLRFLTLGGYGVVTVGGQIDALGRPLSEVLVLLSVVTFSAVTGTAYYLVRVRRGARLAGDQQPVSGPGSRARRGRHAARGPVPERRGEQA